MVIACARNRKIRPGLARSPQAEIDLFVPHNCPSFQQHSRSGARNKSGLGALCLSRSTATGRETAEGQFPVVGCIKDPSGVAALYLGKKEGKKLVYMGKVGTGWDPTTSGKMRRALDTVISPKSKLSKQLKNRKLPGLSPFLQQKLSIAISRQKDCCVPVP